MGSFVPLVQVRVFQLARPVAILGHLPRESGRNALHEVQDGKPADLRLLRQVPHPLHSSDCFVLGSQNSGRPATEGLDLTRKRIDGHGANHSCACAYHRRGLL